MASCRYRKLAFAGCFDGWSDYLHHIKYINICGVCFGRLKNRGNHSSLVYHDYGVTDMNRRVYSSLVRHDYGVTV